MLPSECYETCGLTIWEAYATKRPVVASRIGGIPYSVEEGKTGLLFEPGNERDLAEKITYLIAHPDEADSMGEAGRRFVEDTCETHYDALIEVYEGCLNGPK